MSGRGPRRAEARHADERAALAFFQHVCTALAELLADARYVTASGMIGQPLIFSDINVVQWPRWFAAHGVPLSPASYALRFDRAYMSIEAAVWDWESR